jgi:hypothetical protein
VTATATTAPAGRRRDARTFRLSAWTSAMEALPIWLASRLAVAMAGFAGAWVLSDRKAKDVPSWVDIWQHWDADLFVKVARYGYPPTTAYHDRTEVDFPGMPLALRLVHLVIPNWTICGLVVALVAGGVASVALYHLAAMEWGPEAGRRAVTYLVCFPYAVFLFVGYSEGLFLAFATTSWVFVRKGRWTEASLLCAGAAFTRLLGIVLAAGLAVEYAAAQWRANRERIADEPWRVVTALFTRHLPWLAAPAVSVFAFVWYIQTRTGMWDAYNDAQRDGWGRYTDSIANGFRNVLGQTRLGNIDGPYAWSWRAEMLAVVGGAVLAIVLLVMRRWGEAVYVGGSAYLLAAQNYYASSVRSALIWFPLYLVLARLTQGREWLHKILVAAAAPLMVVFVIVFNRGQWVG